MNIEYIFCALNK